jgi:hypothetical protein
MEIKMGYFQSGNATTVMRFLNSTPKIPNTYALIASRKLTNGKNGNIQNQ